ncbi:hypothetical protein ABZS29_17680 [Kribbella sp. NPDC005582]|uniref:hypothetical protein n=1 Tax=Kribbella sp. NPDC005582 TaxID=3156893 RepID=UPI0033B91534
MPVLKIFFVTRSSSLDKFPTEVCEAWHREWYRLRLVGAYQAKDEWQTELPLSEARSVCLEFIRDHHGQVHEESELTLKAKFGSRSHFRMWGFLADDSILPMTLELTLGDEADGATVASMFESDEGWYLVRTKAAEQKFSREFKTKTAELRSALGR